MAFSFGDSESYLFTSESVTEGHPDKLCDQISDAILDRFLSTDPFARVACEVCVTTGLVVVMGEITLEKGYVDIPRVVRDTIREAGYDDSAFGFDYQSCGIAVSVDEQSSDIDSGVSHSLETRGVGDADHDAVTGAGDQGMMVGYACNETPELMPLPISLAHRICRRMAEVRKTGTLPYLRPDGKSQVTVEYSHGRPKRIDTVVMSAHHSPETSQSEIEQDLIDQVAREVIPADLIDENTRWFVNPSGRFEIGGPVADAGLTGRKIIVDTYGGFARHGGGAFSGKDPTKVDRSGAYAVRHAAKNVVAAGLADRIELQVSYAIGKAEPTSVSFETFGTNRVHDSTIKDLIDRHFDLRPNAIIRDLDLRHPIYKQTAAYGHFGRGDLDLPWERTDRADALRREAFVGEVGAPLTAGS